MPPGKVRLPGASSVCKRENRPNLSLGRQIGRRPHCHIFLQVPIEELVVIQMVHSVWEEGIAVRRRVHISDPQSSPVGVQIGPR